MDVISQHTSVARLVSNFKSIWYAEGIKFFIKNNVLKRVAKYDFTKVAFLEEETPTSYLTACVACGKVISDEQAISIAKSSEKIGAFGYSLWCLGMLGKQHALYSLLKDVSNIEEKLPKEFWEFTPY